MGLMFCGAVFARGAKNGAESNQEVSRAVAQLILGDRGSLQKPDIEFDECLDQVFSPGGGARLFRKSINKAAISVTDDRVIVLSNRCGEWVGSEPEFLAVCARLERQTALALYLDSRVNSAMYFLWESGKVIRSFASREFGVAPSVIRLTSKINSDKRACPIATLLTALLQSCSASRCQMPLGIIHSICGPRDMNRRHLLDR